jgi:hypothetical protein
MTDSAPVANVTVNLTLVGFEGFSAADRADVDQGVIVMRTILAAVDIHLSVDRFRMSVAQAGRLVTITSLADARALTEKAAGPDNTVDMFVVKRMTKGEGWSPVGGPCNKKRKGMTGIVVSLNGDAANRGNTFAHELGHYFGLEHASCSDPAFAANFIRGGGCSSNSNTIVTAEQAAIMKTHCAMAP